MALDIFAILKAVWGFATFVLLGLVKITYSDFKKMKERVDDLDKEVIRLRSEMVTKDSLDEIFDRKMKHIQDSIQDIKSDLGEMRSETKAEVVGLRNDLRDIMKTIVEANNKRNQ